MRVRWDGPTGIADGMLRENGSEYDFTEEIGAWLIAQGRVSLVDTGKSGLADTATAAVGSSKMTKEKEKE